MIHKMKSFLKNHFWKAFLAGFIVFILYLGITTSLNAIKWIGRPFPGFLVYSNNLVAPIGCSYWTGVIAGLRWHDIVLEVDGKPTRNYNELYNMVSEKDKGEPTFYLIERHGNRFVMECEVMDFTWGDFWLTFGILFFSGLGCVLIAILVFILKPNIAQTWAFLTGFGSIGILGIFYFDLFTDIKFDEINLFFVSLFQSLILNFFISIIENPCKRFKISLKILPYIPFPFMLGSYLYFRSNPYIYKIIDIILVIYMLSYTIICALLILDAYFNSDNPRIKRLARRILVGIIPFLPLVIIWIVMFIIEEIGYTAKYIFLGYFVITSIFGYYIIKENGVCDINE